MGCKSAEEYGREKNEKALQPGPIFYFVPSPSSSVCLHVCWELTNAVDDASFLRRTAPEIYYEK